MNPKRPRPGKQDTDPLYDVRGNLLCGARTRQGGGRCRAIAGRGTSHPGDGPCRDHGGTTRNHELRAAANRARREMAVMGVPIPIHPIEAILGSLAIAWGEVQYSSDQIAKLAPADAVGALVTTKNRPLKGEGGSEVAGRWVEEVTTAPPELNIWIRVRREAMDRAVQYGAIALRADVAERAVTIAEQQGRLFAGAIRRILTRLDVIDHPDAPEVVRSELAALATAPGALPALAA